mmetsp:Transcript_3331/g.8286  ORF Transcript_3331/g.8286 Transcript_3331/m.8286 type:complete len:200 (+) Transcript_3331:970-1569(+)
MMARTTRKARMMRMTTWTTWTMMRMMGRVRRVRMCTWRRAWPLRCQAWAWCRSWRGAPATVRMMMTTWAPQAQRSTPRPAHKAVARREMTTTMCTRRRTRRHEATSAPTTSCWPLMTRTTRARMRSSVMRWTGTMMGTWAMTATLMTMTLMMWSWTWREGMKWMKMMKMMRVMRRVMRRMRATTRRRVGRAWPATRTAT